MEGGVVKPGVLGGIKGGVLATAGGPGGTSGVVLVATAVDGVASGGVAAGETASGEAVTGGEAAGATASGDCKTAPGSVADGFGVTSAIVEGGAAPCTPNAWAAGTWSMAPRRKTLGLLLANAPGLLASKIDIICGKLIAVEGRTWLAIAIKVSPDLMGP